MTVLSLYDLLLTALVEVGLGLVAWIGFCKIIPWIRKYADERITYEKFFVTSNSLLVWLLMPWRYSKTPFVEKHCMISKPANMKINIFWMFLQGGVLTLALLIPTVTLITSVGWKLPFQDHLYYNLLFATANGQPNGAHITSYLCVMALMLFVAGKTKDVFLGVLSGALLVGLHEGIWLVFYYLGYWQFTRWFMLTNILKDIPIFSIMIILFVYAFSVYPFNHWHLRDFKVPIILFTIYVALWFFVPHLFFGFSNWLPIRTANLPGSMITSTIYNETPWFWNPWVNGIEVFSWFSLFSSLMVVFARKK